MNTPIKKIVVILIIIILLPAAFFFYNEFSRLSENEEVIEKIYNNQLEAILYSVNQYSEDVTTGWAGKIELLLSGNESEINRANLEQFFNEFSSIKYFFISDVDDTGKIDVYKFKPVDKILSPDEIELSLNEKKDLINQLINYKKENYRKIVPAETEYLTEYSLLLFIINKNKVCGIVFDPGNFVNRILSPKIQDVSQNEFDIVVFNSASNNQIYSTANISNDDIQLQKSLWLIPEYSLGIALRGQTIQQLVEERAFTNLVLISILTLVLLIAVIIVYRNIKRTVELAQIKSDFVSNVSHELRTPLALISMFAETLEMNRVKSEEKRNEYYSIISQESNRLSRIVNKILNFSKMEAGKRTYDFEKTDVNEVLENIYNTYNFHLQNNGFEFKIIKGESLPEIYIDREAVTEAVINLVDNAVKYSKDEKIVVVESGKENNSVYVEVKDKGIGIPEEDQQKIYDKFFRVSTGLVHNVKGTGLGLTLVKHIMDAHNGKIKLKSKEGEGSSFILNFPVNKK